MPIWMSSSHLRKVCGRFSLRLFAFLENGDELFCRAILQGLVSRVFHSRKRVVRKSTVGPPSWPFDLTLQTKFLSFIFIMIKKYLMVRILSNVI